MSKNVVINGENYEGVSTLELKTSSGTTAAFKDVDEIVTPTGTKTINANGTYNVSEFAQAVVNVPTTGEPTDGLASKTGHLVVDSDSAYIKVTGLGFTPKAFIVTPSSTVPNNSTCGAMLINGAGALFRTGTNNSTIGTLVPSVTLKEMTVNPDTTVGNYEASLNAVKVLETGFLVCAYNATFPFHAGMELDWVAYGGDNE